MSPNDHLNELNLICLPATLAMSEAQGTIHPGTKSHFTREPEELSVGLSKMNGDTGYRGDALSISNMEGKKKE